MKNHELTELVKQIERDSNGACQIEVTIINERTHRKKYGDFEKRAIRVVPDSEIEKKEIKSDMGVLAGSYNSIRELKKLVEGYNLGIYIRNPTPVHMKKNLNLQYDVGEDGIFLKANGADMRFNIYRGQKVANIIYERLK
jgi:hypothetical protein